MKRIILALLCLSYLLLPLTSKAQTDEERLQQVLYYYTHLEGYQADVHYIRRFGFTEYVNEKYTLSLTKGEQRKETPSHVSISTASSTAVIDLSAKRITLKDSDLEYPDNRAFFTFWENDYKIVEGSYQSLKGKMVYLIVLKAEKNQKISELKLYLEGKRIVSMVKIDLYYEVQDYVFSNEKINPVFEKDWFSYIPFKALPNMEIDNLREE